MGPTRSRSVPQFPGMQATHTGTIVAVVRMNSIGIQQAVAEQLEHEALLA